MIIIKIWLFFHILGVVLLLGNVVTAAFWKLRADRTREVRVLHEALRSVMLADYLFTIPGTIMILVSGHVMAAQNGYSLAEFSWLSVSYYLFILTGVLWAAVLFPCQVKMIRYLEASLTSGEIAPAYQRVSTVWNVFGTVATILPILVLFLMVVKPF